MKYLIIDDNETFSKQLFKQLTGNESNSEHDTLKPSTETLNVFAESIKSIINANDDVVLCINVNLELAKDSRQLQKGIELLIWLRIKGVMNHCVLYSFEDLHTILNREPKHLIATSKGTTFVQLPNNFQRIKEVLENLKTKNKLLASDDNIKTALKPAINIESIRHQEANWWGIKQLWDVHRLVKSKSKIDFPYPYGVRKAENDIESKICQFVYQTDESKLGSAIKSSTNLKIGSLIHLFKKGQQYEISINDNNFNDFSIEQSLKSSHYILNTRSPRILHIDDQWQDGWGEILCEIIYGKTANNIQRTDEEINSHNWNNEMISVKPTESDFQDIPTYLYQLNLNQFDLIILDLRLEPNKDKYKNRVREMSGALFLQEIRNMTKGIPVLMTTASNKIWSLQELNKLGADAYWMKEGIDNFNNAEDTVFNYYKLLNLLESTTSDRYQLLKYFENSAKNIRCSDKWFKKEITWHNGDKQKLDESNLESIYGLLEDGILMHKTFLHQSFLEQSYSANQIDSYWLTGIINKLSGIIEEIHFPNKPGFDSAKVGGKWGKNNSTNRWEWGTMYRQDWSAFVLLNYRNAASHNKLGKELTQIQLVEIYIKLLIYWLNMSSYIQLEKPQFINNSNWNEISKYTMTFLKTNKIAS